MYKVRSFDSNVVQTSFNTNRCNWKCDKYGKKRDVLSILKIRLFKYVELHTIVVF